MVKKYACEILMQRNECTRKDDANYIGLIEVNKMKKTYALLFK